MNEKTNQTSEPMLTTTQVCAGLGISRQAFYSHWRNHPNWLFGEGPQWPASLVPKMLAWGNEWLQSPDDTDRTVRAMKNADGFYDRVCRYSPPIDIPLTGCDASNDYAKYPSEIVADFEKDVIAGKATMTPEMVQRYVEFQAGTRASLIAGSAHHFASWLHGHTAAEINSRLRSWFIYHFAAIVDCVNDMVDEHANESKTTKRRRGK